MTRDKRRRDRNYTGILRGNRARTEQPEVSQIEERRKFSWRMVSGFMVLALSAILGLFFYADVFYVHTIAVSGVRYMTKEEVFAYADIANMHIFWVQPQVVRERLMAFQTVADAQVRISWPPNMVNIVVEERQPALVWEQNGVAIWVDIQGNVMRQYEDRPGLLRIVAEDPRTEGPLTGQALDEAVVFGALQLQELHPEIDVWRYDAAKGLGFRNANGWDIWLGVGTGMAEKMQIYEAITSDIIARGIQLGELNIVNPDAPVYRALWGR